MPIYIWVVDAQQIFIKYILIKSRITLISKIMSYKILLIYIWKNFITYTIIVSNN